MSNAYTYSHILEKHILELNLLTLKPFDYYDEHDKARDEAKEWSDIKTMLSIDYASAY